MSFATDLDVVQIRSLSWRSLLPLLYPVLPITRFLLGGGGGGILFPDPILMAREHLDTCAVSQPRRSGWHPCLNPATLAGFGKLSLSLTETRSPWAFRICLMTSVSTSPCTTNKSFTEMFQPHMVLHCLI